MSQDGNFLSRYSLAAKTGPDHDAMQGGDAATTSGSDGDSGES